MLYSVIACTLCPWWTLLGGRSRASRCARCGGPVDVTVYVRSTVTLPSGEILVQLRALPAPGEQQPNGHSSTELDTCAA